MIPTFETLGHWENILAKPEYIRYTEFPGAQTLNVSDEKVYAMLDEMIGELCGSFSSPYFNMGADESWDVGLGAIKKELRKTALPLFMPRTISALPISSENTERNR